MGEDIHDTHSSSYLSVDSLQEHFTDFFVYFHKSTGYAKKHMMPYIHIQLPSCHSDNQRAVTKTIYEFDYLFFVE